MTQYAWLILIFPLIGFIVTGLGKNFFKNNSAGIFASLMLFISFFISTIVFFQLDESPLTIPLFNWIQSGNLTIPFSLLIDQVSATMLLIVTGVGFLIHVYSIGYMKGDDGFARFFSYLNLFIFFMLVLIMASDYVFLFAGWEGVGLCSYLLIGFWFKNDDYNKAANKAFIMNRIGDLGFILGIFLIYITFGSTSFVTVFSGASSHSSNETVIIAITILLFVGAMGKSAQIPLYTWLPDAMAGPTPVSALIHAATMVTAGIYMIVRSNILYSLAPFTLDFIAIIGTATAVFAAIIAMAQTDIKKVLAYSTVSQLGYMFVALGAGAYSTALFHVTTHAFFKALLFLAAGSVIHAMSGEQNLNKMGGLRKKLPVTFMVFLIGTLAISGIPPLAGFFSKDEILAKVYLQHPALFAILSFTSILTAIYMFRLLFLAFYGSFRGTQEQEQHLHESPKVMTLPLIILAVLSTVGGFLGMPGIISEKNKFEEFLKPVTSFPQAWELKEPSHFFEWTVVIVSLVVLTICILFAYRRYAIQQTLVSDNENEQKPIVRSAYRKFYVDEIYDSLIVKPLTSLSKFIYNFLDLKIIDGIINSVSKVLVSTSGVIRYGQSGYVGFYIFMMVCGIIAILLFNLVIL
jgi:NADH-quinone oxidoreductase subunit L